MTRLKFLVCSKERGFEEVQDTLCALKESTDVPFIRQVLLETPTPKRLGALMAASQGESWRDLAMMLLSQEEDEEHASALQEAIEKSDAWNTEGLSVDQILPLATSKHDKVRARARTLCAMGVLEPVRPRR